MPTPLAVNQLKTNSRELNLEAGQKVYHLPDWHNLSHPERLTVIRQIAMQRGRDPRIARFATNILKKARIKPRDYVGQARALLRWVQNPINMYYVNEPGERLQDPIYTIKAGHGDCDDLILLLSALYESIGLPWRLVLSGRNKATGQKLRYIEGQTIPENCSWVHIYGMVGDRPFNPARWFFVEPTVYNVPFGWDVIDGDSRYLPEMAKKKNTQPAYIVKLKRAPVGYKAGKLPPKERRSPAYDMGYGDADAGAAVGSSVGASIAESVSSGIKVDWSALSVAVLTGILVSVGTSLTLDWVNGKGIWQNKGTVFNRMHSAFSTLNQSSFLSVPSPLGTK